MFLEDSMRLMLRKKLLLSRWKRQGSLPEFILLHIWQSRCDDALQNYNNLCIHSRPHKSFRLQNIHNRVFDIMIFCMCIFLKLPNLYCIYLSCSLKTSCFNMRMLLIIMQALALRLIFLAKYCLVMFENFLE